MRVKERFDPGRHLQPRTSSSAGSRSDGQRAPSTTQRPPELDLIGDCVHCGFCLPTCPTYVLWGEEMDSPRGRIVLMRAGLEEGSPLSTEQVNHFDNCLGCMACVTACPSGVEYDKLIEDTRQQVERNFTRSPGERAVPAPDLRPVPAPRTSARARAADRAPAPAGDRAAGALRAARRLRCSRRARRCARSTGALPERTPARGAQPRPRRLRPGLRPARVLRRRQRRHGRVSWPRRASRSTPRLPRAAAARCELHAGEDERHARGPGRRSRRSRTSTPWWSTPRAAARR